MAEQEKLCRDEVLKQLNISDDTLSLYEQELEITTDLTSPSLESFTVQDLESVRIFHKLRESGLTFNEIKLLTSFAGILKNVDLEGTENIKSLLSLSPVYRLKQSLNLTRSELGSLKDKIKELEDVLQKEIETRKLLAKEDISIVKEELEAKQKVIDSLDRRLSEALLKKAQLETQLSIYGTDGKAPSLQIKGKKAKELYQTIVQKDLELAEIKKKNEELLSELEHNKEGSLELKDRLELMEDEVTEMELEVEERYLGQISSLRGQIEELVDKKQKEWESYYTQTSEQHRKELLTLQRRHEQEILRLKQKIKEQIEEIEGLKVYKNPLLGLFKIGAEQR